MVVVKSGTRPPWVGLAAAVWVQLSAGNGYTFPLYSPSLKSVLGFNQQQLTILGVANDIGENVSILPGLACNKFPPWAILLVGACCSLLGYGVLWLAVSQAVQSLPYWILWIALCVATNSSAWLGTAVLVTNMRNFPLSRGTVAGILKGYAGLSAAVFTEVYSMILDGSASKLLLFLAMGIPVICLSMMFLIRPCTPASGEDSLENVHFLFTQAASLCLAIFLLATTVLKDMVFLSDAVSYTCIGVMVILLLFPLAIPIKMTVFPSSLNISSSGNLLNENNAFDRSLLSGEGDSNQPAPLLAPSSSASNLDSFYEGEGVSEVDILLAVGEGAVKKKKKKRGPKRGEDFKFCEAVVKADFWLLWVVYFFAIGTAITVLNNLAQIGVSLGVRNTSILLSIFSFCNFIGRLGAGAISEHFVRSKTMPRTMLMTVTLVIMALTYILYASALSGSLHIATGLLGFCYGVQICTLIPTVSELFGLRHFGVIISFMQMGNPLGALLLSGMLASSIYDAQAAKQQSSICLGPECFRLTFLVLAGICGTGTVLGVILTIRIKPVYQMLYAGGSFRLPQTSNH